MPRTLTNLTPALYTAVDTISRELVGFIPSVSSDLNHQRAAIGETVYSPISPSLSAGDITPAVTPPDDGDNTHTTTTLAITKARRVPVRINGEQQRILNDSIGWMNARAAEFAQAMRVLVNEVEADLAALYVKASRAYGTAGTTPFGATPGVSDLANVRQILVDNGAPINDLQAVISTGAGTNLRSLANLYKANEAGDNGLLRRGIIADLMGFAIRESAQVKTHTKGTGASATTNNAGYAVGSTALTLAAAGTGTLLAGDVVTFAGDTANKYIVASGDTDVSDGGTLTVAAPGIRVAMSAATKAITVGNSYTANMVFARSSMFLATRAPAVPAEGDLATDSMIISDPVSGLSFEVREYRQYRQIQYEVSLAWGVACVKPEHCAILLG